jgi:hypothetical protein
MSSNTNLFLKQILLTVSAADSFPKKVPQSPSGISKMLIIEIRIIFPACVFQGSIRDTALLYLYQMMSK